MTDASSIGALATRGARHRALWSLTLVIGYVGLATAALAQSPFEEQPTFNTADLLPGVPLQGEFYTIDPVAQSDGMQITYTIRVGDTPYTANSTALMRVRLAELDAYEKLQEVQGTDVFIEAVGNAAVSPLRGARDLITAPIDTISSAGSGVATYFSNIGHALFGGASDEEANAAEAALGFDAAKRQWAFELGVDPYTTFEPVSSELSTVAWTGVAGGLTVAVGYSQIDGTAGTVIAGTKAVDQFSRMVSENTPAELKKINAAALESMQIDPTVATLFLEHPSLSPTRKTRIVGAVGRLDVSGRQVFIERAILSQNDTEAFLIERWAEMSAAYHEKVQPAARVVPVGDEKSPILQRKDGVLVALLPADYVAWTPVVAQGIGAADASLNQVADVSGKELWLSGFASQIAKDNLTALGWTVREQTNQTLGFQ
ncbi:MAG: hypothetical protein QNJ84_08150 [Alphaproteobacteria bacterium]|nr:hypothetical protein [Alphaproteobacteria bacterium]